MLEQFLYGRGVDVKRMHCDFILTDVAHSETLAPPWMRITLHEQTVPRARRPSFIIVFVSQVYLGVDRRTFSVRSEAVVTTPLRILGGGNVAALLLHALLRNNRSSTVGLYKQRRTSFRSFFAFSPLFVVIGENDDHLKGESTTCFLEPNFEFKL